MRRWLGRDWLGSTGVARRIARRLRPSPLVVLEHRSWNGYAIQMIHPRALRIRLRAGEPAVRVLAGVPAAARAVLMHVDLSRTEGVLGDEPALWDALRRRGVSLVNSGATDIRKRTLHARCAALGLPLVGVTRDDGPPSERVIVKTNLNAGGAPERRLVLGHRGADFVDRWTPDVNDSVRDANGYRVCARGEVPPGVWNDATLVVERFIENADGVFLRVHVAGAATCVSQIWSDLEIKKVTIGARRRVNHFYWTTAAGDAPLGPSTDTVARAVALARRLLADLGVAFGAADCVMDARGQVAVVDANKTPGAADIESQADVVAHLRRGIDDLLATGGAASALG